VKLSTTRRVQRLTTITATAFVAMLACATGASAQPAQTTTSLTAPGSWTVTPYIGVGFSGDLDSATTAIGVAGGYTWTPRISFEGDFNFLPSSEESGVVELDSKEWSLTGNVLYHFSGRRFVPYGAFGLGFGHGSVDVSSSDPLPINLDTSSTEFVVNFGGGVERQIRERLAFRGDLRYFFGGDFVPDFWRLSAGVTFQLPKH
jgi:opacity protein-like surface antigen